MAHRRAQRLSNSGTMTRMDWVWFWSATGEVVKNAGPLVVGVVGIVATYKASGRSERQAREVRIRDEKRAAYAKFLASHSQLHFAKIRRKGDTSDEESFALAHREFAEAMSEVRLVAPLSIVKKISDGPEDVYSLDVWRQAAEVFRKDLGIPDV